MARFRNSCIILFALSVTAAGQLNIQSVLNQFCARHPNKPGCKKPVDILRPETPTPSPGGSSKESCSASSRKCSQLPNFCVPRSIACSVIGSGQQCRIPVGLTYGSQVLLCGDGTPVGIRCGDGSAVPVLTQLLIQCKGANSVNMEPVKSVGVLKAPGDDGGAGVYRCGASGSWEPLFGSPAVVDLTHSCRNSECGRVPQPGERLAIHRRWSWVRAIYSSGRVLCTGTIVSPTALLTAAHCLTRSQVSTQPRRPQDFQLELPGPNDRVKRLTVTPEAIHIHPGYRPQAGRQHDLALVFFKGNREYNLPMACIADRPHGPTRASLQVVFGLGQGLSGRSSEEPVWSNSRATWDSTCRVVGTRSGVPCEDQLVLQPSQFCASHPDLLMIEGSSGGPYLAEVGTSLQEVWVVLGVLSHFTNSSSCSQGHSIYSQVAEDSDWIKNCIFDGRCK